jgi:hypothetical protein
MIRIPTRTHGIIDYIAGSAMIAAPFLMKDGQSLEEGVESINGVEGTVLAAVGAATLAQNLISDHELGAMKVLNMPAHLLVDVATGVLLAASPWLLNMNPKARLPIAALGLGIAVMGLLTEMQSEEDGSDEE